MTPWLYVQVVPLLLVHAAGLAAFRPSLIMLPALIMPEALNQCHSLFAHARYCAFSIRSVSRFASDAAISRNSSLVIAFLYAEVFRSLLHHTPPPQVPVS